MQCSVKEGKWGSNDDNEQKGDDSKDGEEGELILPFKMS